MILNIMTPDAECHYAECLSFLNGMLSVIMLNVIMLSAIAPSQRLKKGSNDILMDRLGPIL